METNPDDSSGELDGNFDAPQKVLSEKSSVLLQEAIEMGTPPSAEEYAEDEGRMGEKPMEEDEDELAAEYENAPGDEEPQKSPPPSVVR